MSAPFGIEFYTPVTNLTILEELSQGKYVVSPPKAHPLFESYIVEATPALGIVWVKGLSSNIENDNFGNATRGAVDRIAEQLAVKYGKPKKIDMLMQGSIWTEPQDWMSGLSNRERFYSHVWEKPAASQLPADLNSIYVGALAVAYDSATVVLEYASSKMQLAEAELERQMSDLL